MKSKPEVRAVCSIKGLVEKGYPEHFVRDVVTDKRLGLAFKAMPSNPKSRWLVDVEKFNAYVEKKIKLSAL